MIIKFNNFKDKTYSVRKQFLFLNLKAPHAEPTDFHCAKQTQVLEIT